VKRGQRPREGLLPTPYSSLQGRCCLAWTPTARAFEEVEGLLDSRREALDLLGLPFQIEIPVHPSDQVVRFVVEALRRVVQALPEVGKEPQLICAPFSLPIAAICEPVGDPLPTTAWVGLPQKPNHLIDQRLHIIWGYVGDGDDVP
jgi:hypothetical protein